MRYLGIFGMALAAWGAGMYEARRWRERLEILLLLRQMVVQLKGQILYANAALPEAFLTVGRRACEGKCGVMAQPGLLFVRTARRMEKERGTAFFTVWKQEMERLPADFPIGPEERQALLALGENMGYGDRETQERTLSFYLEQTDGAIRFLRGEMETRTKLYRCLGAAGGLFLFVALC